MKNFITLLSKGVPNPRGITRAKKSMWLTLVSMLGFLAFGTQGVLTPFSNATKQRTNNGWRLASILLALVLGLGGSLQTLQAQNYQLSYFTGTYAPITGTPSGTTGDGTISGNFALPFPVTFGGTAYSNFQVSTDGWVTLNNGVLATNTAGNLNLFNTTAPNVTIAPWMDDLHTAPTGGPVGDISYTTTGTSPNQVLTIQYNNYPSYWTGTTVALNFQVKIYETTNVIEFWYGNRVGALSGASPSESASVGIEWGTGGLNNFIDGSSGSRTVGNGFLNSIQFPTGNHIRYTPIVSALTPLAAGTYTVGSGGTYPNIKEAFADINQRGIAGAITLTLLDATNTVAQGNFFPLILDATVGTSATNTITINGGGAATISYSGGTGSVVAGSSTTTSTTLASSTAEPLMLLAGTDYVSVLNTNFVQTASPYATPARLDRGILLTNLSATNGATNNLIQGVNVTLDRVGTSSVGLAQAVLFTPTSFAGSNSNNKYYNFSIKNSYAGVLLTGNATFPDVACEVGTTACSTYNTIGDPAVPNDIGNGTILTYGVKATNQSGVKIFNNAITNITNTSTTAIDGIFLDNATITATTSAGICQIYGNKISNLFGNNAASGRVVGIRANLNANATSASQVYNNWVSALNSTSTVTTSRRIVGIMAQESGAGAGAVHNIDFNNVSLAPAGIACPNACFEIGSASTGATINVRNNVFSNTTAAQAGAAKHYCWASTGAANKGGAGSISNYNDLWVANANGFVGLIGTDQLDLAAWKAAAPASDANSISVDPLFSNANTDLHVSAAGLNGGGNNTGIAWVTNDIDCQTRPLPAATNFDIGADEIQACVAAAGGTITPSTATRCSGQTYTMTSVGAEVGAGITYQWEISATGGGAGFAPVSGGSGATTTAYTTAALAAGTYYYRLNVTCNAGPVTGYSNELVVTVNASPVATVNNGSVCSGTPAVLTATGGGTYAWSPATGLDVTNAAVVNASPATTTTYTVTVTNAASCTTTATSLVTVQPALNAVASATPTAVCAGGNSQLNVAAGNTTAYTVAPATFGLLTATGTVTNTATGDDALLNTLALPFNFSFFGTNYSNILVYSNGYVAFQTGVTGSPYVQTIPDAAAPNNFIAISHDDLNVTTAGQLSYFTNGVSPNRIFVINYNGVKYYNTAANDGNLSGQIQIFEADQHIEIHVQNSVDPTLSAKSLGIENATGTVGYAPASRNNLSYDITTPEAWSFTPSGGTLSYAWDESPALPTTLSATNIANPLASGITVAKTYTVTVTEAVSGCTKTATVNVSAGNPLTATPTATPAAICLGQSSTLAAGAAGGGLPYTYLWDDLAASTTATISVSPASTTTYNVTVSDVCGASTTASITLTVNTPPSAAITANPPSAAICGTGSVALSVPAGETSYAWLPTTNLSPTNAASVTASPTATTTYTVTVTAANACTATASRTVTVVANPVISSVTATPTSVCVGGTSQLQVNLPAPSAYCTSVAFTIGVEAISLVQFAGINNSSTCGIGGTALENFTSISGNVVAGSTYPITLSGTTDGSFTNFFTAFFDWNQDGIFETTVPIGNIANTACVLQATNNVTVPPTALNGTTRMRIVKVFNSSPADPCGTYGFGQAEDYSIVVTGGINSATYAWSPATGLTPDATSASVTTPALSANTTYTVTVTNGAGCTATGSVTVTAAPLTIAPTANLATICAGASSTLSAGATGGGAPYTYVWNDGVSDFSTAASPSVSPTTTTTYSVTVTDSCSPSATATGTVTITVNPTPTASAGSNSPVCVGSALNLTSTTDIGTTFAWAGPNTFSSALQNPTIASATVGAAGTYTVTVTLGTCSATATTTVALNPVFFTSGATATPTVVCANGTSTLNVSAGNTTAYSVSSTTFGLLSGTGTTAVIGDDVVGAAITLPFAFNFFGTSYTTIFPYSNGFIQLGTSSNSTGTYGATIPTATDPQTIIAGLQDDLNVTGGGTCTYFTVGSAPNRVFVVSWNNVKFYNTAANNGNATFQIQLFENDMHAEVHIAEATDPVASPKVVGIENQAGTLGYSPVGRNFATFDIASTSPEAWAFRPSGGTYTYAWAPSADVVSPNAASTATNAIAATTTYTVTVTDSATGCTATSTVTVNVPTITATNNGPVCVGSPINFTATPAGATSYAWAGPGTLTGGTTATPSIASAVVGDAGVYTVTVTNASTPITGCTATTTVVVNAVLIAPTLAGTTYCVGSTATALDATTAGATAYLWSDGSTNATLTPSTVAAGSTPYTVTVTAPTGCTDVTASATIVVNTPITAPTLTSANYCVGSTATNLDATTAGALGYLWTGGATTATLTPSTASAGSTTYTVTVTAPTGCTDVTATATVIIYDPIVAPTLSGATYCVGSTATALDATTTGATGYLWSTTATTASITPSTASAGSTTYTVTVSAPANCPSVTASATVLVNTPITAPTLSGATYCVGSTATALDATTAGAIAYLWSDASTNATLTPSTASAGSTTYAVTVTAPTGCTDVTASATVVVNAPITAPTLISTDYCLGSTATALDATTAGATGYLWSTTATTASITPSTASAGTTTYTVTVSAPTGCTNVTATAAIVVHALPTIASITNTPTGCSSPSGTATVTPTGGTPSYTYLWSDGAAQTNATATGLAVGNYAVTVSDANLCTATGTTTISAAGAPIATATPAPASLTICQGGTISVAFNVTNALPGEKFAVSFNIVSTAGAIPYGTLNNNASFTVGPFTEGAIFAGNVTLQNIVIASQTSNCSVALSDISFTVNPKPVVSIPTTTVCFGATNGTLTANVTSAAMPFTYLWSNTQTTNPATGLAAGTYTLL